MKKQTANRASLLLIEIIFSILFFALISAVCLQLFVESHTMSRDAAALDAAVNETSSVAALLSHTDNMDAEAILRDYYPDLSDENDSLLIYYNKDFTPCRESEAAFSMRITWNSEAERMTLYTLEFSDLKVSAQHIYELDTRVYYPL